MIRKMAFHETKLLKLYIKKKATIIQINMQSVVDYPIQNLEKRERIEICLWFVDNGNP